MWGAGLGRMLGSALGKYQRKAVVGDCSPVTYGPNAEI